MSEVREDVRVRLLKALACAEYVRREHEEKATVEKGAGVVDIRTGLTPEPGHWPTHFALWENDWGEDADFIETAVREARALGQIHYEPPTRYGAVTLGPFVRITPAGIAWLRKTGNLPKLADGTTIFARPLPAPPGEEGR